MRDPDWEIIIHCYSIDRPEYWRALCYQLSSLVTQPSGMKVVATVFYHPEDVMVMRVLWLFRELTNDRFFLYEAPLKREYLFRRAIGRNLTAKNTDARYVWFADCDYFVTGDFLHRMATHMFDDHLYFPLETRWTVDRKEGEAMLAVLDDPQFIENPVEMGQFEPKTEDRAIGGIQFVQAHVARRGYLDETKWVEPQNEEEIAKPFYNFRDDIKYRTMNNFGYGTPIDAPGLYRIRHHPSYEVD